MKGRPYLLGLVVFLVGVAVLALVVVLNVALG